MFNNLKTKTPMATTKIINNFNDYDNSYDFKPFIDAIEEKSKSTTVEKLMDLKSVLYFEHQNSYSWSFTYLPKENIKIPHSYGALLRIDFREIFSSLVDDIEFKPMIYNRDLIFTIVISGNK